MVLSTTKRTRHISSITNKDTQGGSKKAGFPYQIGRSWRSSLALNAGVKCCNIQQINMVNLAKKTTIPHNIGRYVGGRRA
jgi:hypothetical protein